MREPGTDEALLRKPFDHYARYRLAADVCDAVRAGGPLAVLDVGGGPGSLAAFVPGDTVYATDLVVPDHWHEPAPRLFQADGARLPLRDGAVDLVVSLDTLEHVPAHARAGLLAEAMRVACSYVLIVCPCATPGVVEADEALLAYVRHRFGDAFPTVTVLEEHLGYGHPDPQAVEAALRAGGAEVAVVPSGRIDRWLPMMLLFFHLLGLGDDEPVERVQRWYNGLLYRDDLRGPAYRQAFIARLPCAAGPTAAEVAAALAPDGAPLATDVTALAALQLGLESGLAELVGTLRQEQADAHAATEAALADHRAALEVADRQSARAEDAEGRAAAAEQEAAALRAFREQVLAHPAMRARRQVKRLFGRNTG